MVFVKDSGTNNVDSITAGKSTEMFAGEFDEQWAPGRPIRTRPPAASGGPSGAAA